MPAHFLFGSLGQTEPSDPATETSMNSPSVSELNLALADGELLRLIRSQARRRGKRAEKLRCRALDQDKAYRQLNTEFNMLMDHRVRLERELMNIRKELTKTKALLAEAEYVREAAARKIEGEMPEGHVCAICLDAEANCACYPCYHVSMCQECVKVLKRNARESDQPLRCPICKTDVITTTRLYFA